MPADNQIGGVMNGGRAMAEMLRLHGVGPMFGMAGFQLLPFYDAIGRMGLTHNLINDERTGVFAADAYARVTNRPGVCDATLGPGATNLATGLVESLNAGTPMVVFTGDANRTHAWKNMTQEARQVDILTPAVKEMIRVEMTSRIPELIRRAFAVATSGRPGPVLIDVPEDVAHGEHDFDPSEFVVDETTLSSPSRRTRPSHHDIERAAALLGKAKRPLILVGGGIHLSQAHGALQALAEALNIPVAHTMSGKGSIACTHPLSAGLFGRYSRIANDLIAAADCLLVVGCKLGEIATKRYALLPATVPIIHLEVMPEEIGRIAATEVALCGDAREGLVDLLEALRSDAKRLAADHKHYVGEVGPRMDKWRSEASSRLNSTEKPVNMARMMTELNRVMPDDSILIADGGFAAHWSGLLYDTKRAGRHYIADRGFASIGYGLPGGIGASLAAPDAAVVSLTGDGGFNMTIGDLETARRAGACPTMIVVNNAASGYVKALQHTMYEGRYQSSDLIEMNYARIGAEMGCQGIRVEDPEEFAGAVERGMAERSRPTIVDVVVTRDPAKMLPGVDNRAAPIKKGDRIA